MCRTKFIAFNSTTADTTLRARARCDFFEPVYPGFSRRSTREVQRAACSQACGAGAFVRGIGSRPAPRRCNARVTDYLRHTTLPTAHCRYTQAPGRATCCPDRRLIDPIRRDRGKTRARARARGTPFNVHLRDDLCVQARHSVKRHSVEALGITFIHATRIYKFIYSSATLIRN